MRAAACLILLAVAAMARGQPPTDAPLLVGHWIATMEFNGTTSVARLDLVEASNSLTGSLDAVPLSGTLERKMLRFRSGSRSVTATVADGVIMGTMITEGDKGVRPFSSAFSAARIPDRRPGPPQTIEFTPTSFQRSYSPQATPVLRVWPGDTVHTTTIDAGGVDAQGIKRAAGGDPLTGPIYVETAMPGDTLAVHLVRLRLNRDWAGTNDHLVDSALTAGLARRMDGINKPVRWRLDLEKNVGTPEGATGKLANYVLPLRPMIGSIAVAAPPGDAAPMANDSGFYGGNMDFNLIREAATVYLTIQAPGALLYVGDVHAAQGDGELNGNALETSADVTLTVDVIPGRRPSAPRVENEGQIMATGFGGSVDDALRMATSNMAGWLAQDYGLGPSEVAQVLGTAAQYQISEIADRNSGVVLKIDKPLLSGLAPAR